MNWRKHSLHLLWIIPVIVVDVYVVLWLKERGRRLAEDEQEAALLQPAPAPEPIRPPWKGMVYPTDQTNLLGDVVASTFQPTASGRPESGLYGSVRTANRGGGVMPSFHEGIDIASLQRDRAGRPLDEVRAAADGKVAYINRVSGNSNYGKYVVLLHRDPMGEIYTLYAHLAEARRRSRPGQPCNGGRGGWKMGNTSSSPIPMERGHLHFEIGADQQHAVRLLVPGQQMKPTTQASTAGVSWASTRARSSGITARIPTSISRRTSPGFRPRSKSSSAPCTSRTSSGDTPPSGPARNSTAPPSS